MGKAESVREHTGGLQLPPVVDAFAEEAREWCAGKMWIPRALLLPYFIYAELRYLRDPMSGSMFSGITFAFHEMGHVIFSFAGHFIGSLMGSGLQLLIPAIVVYLFYRQGDFFGMPIGGFWLSFSLFDLSNYIGDARALELPLVGFTDDPEHDWHYLLSTVGLLEWDTTLAFLARASAAVIGLASLAFAAWLLWTMATYQRTRESV